MTSDRESAPLHVPGATRMDSPLEVQGSTWRNARPILALLLLSPLISEVLFGTTRITTIFVLLPQIGIWGCATLLIRDMVRRRRGGRFSLLLLGLALAVAEECLIQRTSLAPLVGSDPNHPYGRSLGVNWVYFLWALVYESIWVVVLPIQLVEIIFPDRRDEPWLRWRGLVTCSVVFLVSSFFAWYLWTQVFVPKFFPELAYDVPLPAIVLSLAAIAALTATALVPGADLRLPRPQTIGLIAFLLGLPWFGLVFIAYRIAPSLPPFIPIVAGLAVAGAALFLITSWSASAQWQDSHSLALIFGALLASMLAGFAVLRISGAAAVDVAGKVAFNLIAIVLLIRQTRVTARQ